MATEKLIVELQAETAELEKRLNETEKQLKDLDTQTEKNDKSLLNMSNTGKIAAGSITGVTAAAGAAITAITSLTVTTSEYAKEIKIASDLSGVAAEELQLMAHATATVGIGLEQLGDISKDTREKVGDFLNTGGGGFQDFADAMKLTKDEARELALEFSELSGPEVLQEMVDRMEEANVSAVQMSHALEGMASDTTKLIPLLKDGGRELQAISDAMAGVVVPLSDDDIDMFIKMGQSADLAAKSLESLTNTVLLALGEAFIDTADKAAHFYASLNEGTQAQLTSRLVEINEEIATLEESMVNAESGWGRVWNTLTFNTTQEKFALEDINELLEERKSIQAELAEASGLTLPEEGSGDEEAPTVGGSTLLTADDNAKAIQSLMDRFKTEEELLIEKYERELELAAGNKELMLELENEFTENLLALDEESDERQAEAYQAQLDKHQQFLDDKKKQEDKAAKDKEKLRKADIKEEEKSEKQKRRMEDAGLSSAMAINTALFDDNKAIRSGLIVADTAMAISRQFADLPYPAALASSAAIAANGAIQLAAVNSSSKGGGTVSSPSTSSSAGEAQQPSVTGEVEINESIGSGGQTSTISNTITFKAEDGDELANVLVDIMNSKINSGEKSLG
ncbi:MAG: hypothetical protein BA864_05205 [Desulfuromonadales bacterium C00003093]|jgi:hypothetical protein|nr:MAG: hypothetical protein BA864_05205 [Desulfuromonadales bacterium C00003093]